MRTRRNGPHPGPVQTETSYAIELVYRIQLLRLAFGYSQSELSFLLGYPSNRVRAIEDLGRGVRYTMNDLLNLSHIFECPTIRFLPHGPIHAARVNIRTARHEQNGKCIHEAWECAPDSAWELRWRLPERSPEYRPAAEPPALLERTRTLIRSLISGGYFHTPWEAFEIYRACRHSIGNQLRPLTLNYALLSFTGEDKPLQVLLKGDHQTWIETTCKQTADGERTA